jgi:hypothetical protein
MKRNSIFLFAIVFLFILVLENCRKSSSQKVYIGTVIGFDQCNGRPFDSASKGYVIKIEKISGIDTIAVDTAMCYNLSKVFTFHPQLFTAY